MREGYDGHTIPQPVSCRNSLVPRGCGARRGDVAVPATGGRREVQLVVIERFMCHASDGRAWCWTVEPAWKNEFSVEFSTTVENRGLGKGEVLFGCVEPDFDPTLPDGRGTARNGGFQQVPRIAAGVVLGLQALRCPGGRAAPFFGVRPLAAGCASDFVRLVRRRGRLVAPGSPRSGR